MRLTLNSKKLLHVGFEISLIIKGIDGVMEILGGVLFLFINPARMNSLINFMTLHEISEDPKDYIANMLINLSHGFSSSLQTFIVIYLISHGLIKIILVLLLYMKNIWSYPASIGFLMVFIVYQIHRYLYSHSILMILLTLFDMIMIWLVLLEYKQVKASSKAVR
jgi:uncharacterized membrane protein